MAFNSGNKGVFTLNISDGVSIKDGIIAKNEYVPKTFLHRWR